MPKQLKNKTLDNPVYYFKKNDLSTIKIRWKCNGENFTTLCLVSESKGIIYDNFLYFLALPFREVNEIGENPLIETRTESETGSNIRYQFRLCDKGYNYYGVNVWSYDFTCNVTEVETEEGNSITDMSMNALFDSAVGWSCEAKIQGTSLKTGTDGHLKFARGYCYGPGFTASVSWNGIGFSFSGGSTGNSGVEYANPSELY